jgi:hypothetical protein
VHYGGSEREEDFLKAAFSLHCLFNCAPEDYVQPLPGWEKTLSIVGRKLTVRNQEIRTPAFTLRRKHALWQLFYSTYATLRRLKCGYLVHGTALARESLGLA